MTAIHHRGSEHQALDREARAALLTPPRQDRPPGAGAHTRAEAVHALPAASMGLISTLHDRVLVVDAAVYAALPTSVKHIGNEGGGWHDHGPRFPFLFPQPPLPILAPLRALMVFSRALPLCLRTRGVCGRGPAYTTGSAFQSMFSTPVDDVCGTPVICLDA